MNILIAAFLVLGQGIPILPSDSGTVAGIVRGPDGTPAADVRIAAMARPDSLQEAAAGAAFASLVKSDAAGRYRLENIPPGRYFISAGRVDTPTYFPGTLDLKAATEILVTRGGSIADINFVVNDISLRPVSASGILGTLGLLGLTPGVSAVGVPIPVSFSFEGGKKIPVFADGAFPSLRATRVSDGLWTEVSLGDSVLAVPVTNDVSGEAFRVSIQNLPQGYRVKSINYGEADLTTSTLKISVNDPAARSHSIVAGAGMGIQQQTLAPFAAGSSTTLSVVLEGGSGPVPPGGVRVTGIATNVGRVGILLSGNPGILYSDGTFEFRGVPRGRHVLVTSVNPASSRLFGVSVVVGDTDVENVTLEPISFLPYDVKSSPRSAGAHPPGSTVLPKSIRARLIDEPTQRPIDAGTIQVNGKYISSIDINADGRFEIRGLLPGRYDIDVQMLDYQRIKRTIELDDQDIEIELTTKRRFE